MGKEVRTSSVRESTGAPKTLTAYGHRYRVVQVTNTEARAEAGKNIWSGKSAVGVIVRKIRSGKWVVAVRDSLQIRRFLTGR
jgi:hypothetical protein